MYYLPRYTPAGTAADQASPGSRRPLFFPSGRAVRPHSMERIEPMSVNITEIFGSNVFSTDVMRERLPKGVFREVMDVMENGGNISIETADIVANAMKDWAVERAPPTIPTGSSLSPASPREKHDSFLTRPENSRTLLQLTRQAADHGGVRRLLPSPPAGCAPPTTPGATPPGT